MKKTWAPWLLGVWVSVFVAIVPLEAGLPQKLSRNYFDIVKMLKHRARQGTVTPFIQAFFPPHDRVQELVCGLIDEETERIDVEAFQLTNRAIAQSLLEAHYRGVKVQMIVDVGALGRFSKVLQLYNAGIPVFVYPQDGIGGYSLMHNKIMLLYSLSCIITGSMNFTNAGVDKNRENLVVIQNEELFEEYAYQFKALSKNTTPLGQAL
jgi:phosphatidylserine/phosphatidylglycerophosphate/cardiolipin synthase-like enzyme